MMRISFDTTDFSYSDDGDILFDNKGDIRIVNDIDGKVSSETIAKRVFSNPGDWRRMPSYGSGVFTLVGSDTSNDIVSLIKSFVTDELVKEMAFNTNEFQVKVIPLGLRNYAVVVILQKGYMKSPVVVSTNISSNYFSNKNSNIASIGLGVK